MEKEDKRMEKYMNWKRYFTSSIWERGKRYQRDGFVDDLKKVGDTYTAVVYGSHRYQVAITVKIGMVESMGCNCPYAREGRACKHMAAVCVEIDEFFYDEFEDAQISMKEELDPVVKPFAVKNTVDSKVYTYFDLSVMTDKIVIKESQLQKARQLVEKKEVVLENVHIGRIYGYAREDEQAGKLTASYVKNGVPSSIIVNFTTSEITQALCYLRGCGHNYYGSSYYGSKEVCVHILAALLLLEKYIEIHNPGDTTNYEAKSLLSIYHVNRKNKIVSNEFETVEDVHFEPRLEVGWNNLLLSFRVGTSKLYVAKNLTELVEKIETGMTQTFGKNFDVDFGIHKVAEDSKALYRFLRKIVKEEEQRTEVMRHSSHYYDETIIKDTIPLFGNRLDEFFEIMHANGNGVNYQNKYNGEKKKQLYMRDTEYQMQLYIDGEFDRKNIFKGIVVSGETPKFFRGDGQFYYIEDMYLNRINESSKEELLPLLEMSEYEHIRLEFGRKMLADFYHHLMPALSECVEFVDRTSDIIEMYVAPKAEFRFYLDAEADVITCDAKVKYGDTEYSLYQLITENILADELRDMSTEAEATYHLYRYFPDVDEERGLFIGDREEETVFTVLEKGVSELLTVGEVFCTERLKRITVHKKTPMTVGVSLESGIMNLDISSEEYSNEELLDILKSYRKRKKYHQLRNGDYLSLEDESLQMLDELMDSLHINSKEFLKGNIKIPAYRALYLDKVLEKNKSVYTERDKHFKSLIKEFKTVSDSDFEVPESLHKIMRKYQTIGFRWLKTLDAYQFGGILADDMGLGKTLQVISVLLAAKKEGQKGTSLIISPASLVYNWQEEFKRFAPEINTAVLSGNQSARTELLQQYQEFDVLITSYDLLKRDIGEYEEKQFLYQVLDEAQYIKNHNTAVAKAVKCINSKTKYALTGTPIENRLSELWSIFDYLMPGFLYGYEVFRKELETPITKNKDEEASNRLKRMISPFILRRLKQDVLTDLPEKLEEIQYAKFEPKQQKLYDGQVVHMKEMLAKQSGTDFAQSKIQILAELTKLRQICCDPSLLFENFDGESAKRQACVELIKSAIEGEHRMLIFSQFTSMLALLEENLTKEGISYYKITGSTSKEDRIRLVKSFNEGDIPVFLISLKAGGTGLNLVGADVVIHYDPWWNQAVQNQATDRAHRIGQKKIVTVYKLIAKGTIEEKIVKLQESKKNLADEILSGEHGGLAQLSKEELLELL